MTDLLRDTLKVAVRDAQIQRARAKMATRDAKQALQVLRAPDANLRAMLAELSADFERLRDDNNRLCGELAAVVAMVEGP